MTKGLTGFGLAVVMAVSLGTVVPASAEFFGCDNNSKVSVRNYSGTARVAAPRVTYTRVSHQRAGSTWSLSASGKRRAW